MKRVILILVGMYLFCSIGMAAGKIDIANIPYVITTAGSYQLVTNLQTVDHQTAIYVSADNVSIDLNGHILYGSGTTNISTNIGIYGIGNNLHITNGFINSFSSIGIFITGINAAIDHLTLYGNKTGIIIADNALIENNRIISQNGEGISAGQNCIIKNNIVQNSLKYGIRTLSNNLITGNVCVNNYTGIVDSGGNNLYENNVCNNNQYDGIATIGSSQLKNNICNSNQRYGISSLWSANIIGNTMISNGNNTTNCGGLYVQGGQCIENNTFSTNSVGIVFSGNNNYYAGNRFQGNPTNLGGFGSNTAGNGVYGFQNIFIP